MGGSDEGTDRLTDGAAAPGWDRFAHWGTWPARLLLAVVAVLLALAALTPLTATQDGAPAEVPEMSLTGESGVPDPDARPERDKDLAFYDRVIERIEGGESYYDFIVEEQRASDYPLRPGVTVRLPTLAYIHAWLGKAGMIVVAIALLFATVWAWWRRLGDEPGGARVRILGTALMLMGGSLGLNRAFFVLHELWAGMLVALGWAGWKSPAGTTGTFLYLGYGLAFMLAGRENNYYWGAVVGPAMFVGLAFLPIALRSLVRSAR